MYCQLTYPTKQRVVNSNSERVFFFFKNGIIVYYCPTSFLSHMADTAIRVKGIADVVVAGIVMVKPNWIYQSAVTKGLHSLTGLVSFFFFSLSTMTGVQLCVQHSFEPWMADGKHHCSAFQTRRSHLGLAIHSPAWPPL
jgi:hypothetical protein